MKYLNKFENFDNDEGRSVDTTYPEYNAVDRLKAKQYVESVFGNGAGDEVNQLCQEVGLKMPKNDNDLDEIKEKAIDYFIKNPERIQSFGNQEMRKMPYNGGDGVVRTNNVGGVHESKKPSPDDENSTKIELTKPEMSFFSSKTQLINLIRRNKITLHNGEVWYNKNDEQTISILDLFFEIPSQNTDEETEINENSTDKIFMCDILSVRRKRDDVIFKVGDTYLDAQDHEYTIASITEGGGGTYWLNATEGGFINVLNAVKI